MTFRPEKIIDSLIGKNPLAKAASVEQLASCEPIYSRYNDDPVVGPLLTIYINNLEKSVQDLWNSKESGDREQILKILHQLKGSSGAYGYENLCQELINLEVNVLSNEILPIDLGERMTKIAHLAKRISLGIKRVS